MTADVAPEVAGAMILAAVSWAESCWAGREQKTISRYPWRSYRTPILPSGRRATVEYAELPGQMTSFAGQVAPLSRERLRTVLRRSAGSWLLLASSQVSVSAMACPAGRGSPSNRAREPLSPGSGRPSTAASALQVCPPSPEIAESRRGVARLCSSSRPSLRQTTLFSLGAAAPASAPMS